MVKNKREIGEPITQVTPRLSIVVLPFANLSNDPEQEYFADGITDDLTTDLSRIPDALVIARSTAFTYKGKSVDAKQIGRELGVRYLLDGSVRRTADQVRVNVQLIDAEGGVQLWADRFDTDRANLPAAQDEITGRLARTFNLELVKDLGRRIEQEGAVDPDARDLVMRGWAWYHRPRSATTIREAQRAFERALESSRARSTRGSALHPSWLFHWPTGGAARPSRIKRAPNCYSLKRSSATQSARWRISRWGSSADFRTD
jgi:adenylate cyclase